MEKAEKEMDPGKRANEKLVPILGKIAFKRRHNLIEELYSMADETIEKAELERALRDYRR